MLYPGQQVLEDKYTPYSHLVVTGQHNERNLYVDGALIGSSYEPAKAEESVHYALAQLEQPKRILLISEGDVGAIQEVLKYPVERLDYVTLDPGVISLIPRFFPVPADPRLQMIAADARQFVRAGNAQYDAVLMVLADPSSAQLNRFYTVEFFADVQHLLRQGGVFGFSLSGAENYSSPKLALVSASVYRSLTSVFPQTLAIPGERRVFIGADHPLGYDIAERLEAKNIHTLYVNSNYLKGNLTSDRLAALNKLVSLPAPLNTEMRPIGYYAYLRYWLSEFEVQLIMPALLAGSVIVVSLLLILFSRSRVMSAAVFSSGFAGLGLEVVLIIAFQVFYGSLYQQMGVLFAFFLAGASTGAVCVNRMRATASRLFVRFDGALAALGAVLPVILVVTQTYQGASLLLEGLFPISNALIGFTVGGQFALAAKVAFTIPAEKTAAQLYGLDFLGAALGGIVVGSFFVPLLGLVYTCLLIAAVKLITFGILWKTLR
jgi:spermidine synthase